MHLDYPAFYGLEIVRCQFFRLDLRNDRIYDIVRSQVDAQVRGLLHIEFYLNDYGVLSHDLADQCNLIQEQRLNLISEIFSLDSRVDEVLAAILLPIDIYLVCLLLLDNPLWVYSHEITISFNCVEYLD